MIKEVNKLILYIEEARQSVELGESPITALKKLQYELGEMLRLPLDIEPMELSADESEGLLMKASNEKIIETLRINHEMLTRAKIYEEEFKGQLKAVMERDNIKRTSNDFMFASYVEASTSKRFDAKRFREENPELAEEYMKETERKAYVRVSYKD